MRPVILLVLAAALAAGCGDTERPVAATPVPTAAATAAPTAFPTVPPSSTPPYYDVSRPNIVFVLTDDLTTDLIRFMPHVQELERNGMSFNNYIVSDSLCCPSRASILTGRLPHNTGVYTNIYPHGGIFAFATHDNGRKSFAVTLRAQGYRTALMGKYLNGYRADSGTIPPGWTDWAATARAYQGFDYTLNLNGAPTFFGTQPDDYITDVMSRRGASFVDAAAQGGRPFLLELATFTPHRPAVAAPRHSRLFPDARAPRGAAYNRALVNAPPWLRARAQRPQFLLDRIDRRYRSRARSVVAIDDMVGNVMDRLRATGQLMNTYFVFSSDNGYHMGEHRLLPGKLTAFDTDIRVPLIITGPGVIPGTRVDPLVQNTDLTPTFEQLAGALPRPGIDGRSLVGLLRSGQAPSDWRPAALVEHRHTARSANDPDEQTDASGDPPTYKALRTATGTYVEYADGEHEYYGDRYDPDQLRNAYHDLSRDRRRALHALLGGLVRCSGAERCATAPAPRAARAGPQGRRRGRRH